MAPLTGRLLTAVATGVIGAGIALGVARGETAIAVVSGAGLVAVTAAWVVVGRVPASAVGPALAWSSAAVAGVLAVEVVGRSADSASPLPLAGIAEPLWVGLWPAHLVGVLALLLVFPDGRLPGRRWSLLPAAYLLAMVVTVADSWRAHEVDGRLVGGPSGGWAVAGGLVGFVTIGTCLVVAVGGVAARYRRGDGRRREQIRWLMLAAAVTVGLLVAGWAAQAAGAPLGVSYTPFLVGIVVLLPVAVGVAIVRHDLFDVGRLLDATTSWTLTLLASAAVFAAVVLVVGRAVGAGTGLAPTGAAFVTALTLLPLQRHLAALTGRLVDPDRFVAVAEVEQFAAAVRSGDRAPEEIEEVLRRAQGDPRLRLYLARPSGAWTDLDGAVVDAPDGLAVRANGAVIATLVLDHDSARARHRAGDLARAGWVTIEVSRLRLALREAVAEAEAARTRLAGASAEERRRLERDLHDGVQPRLVATGMRLRSLQRHGLGESESREVDVAVAELEATVHELRRLAHGIRPRRLDDGLGAALASLGADGPVPVDVTVDPLPELDDARALTAYFVVSEAVANALKHARASRIEVRVGETGGRLVVDVRDDGVGGVSPGELTGLHDRVRSLAGHLHVESAAGIGTTIRAEL
jgi:signal transduction histidine kinase